MEYHLVGARLPKDKTLLLKLEKAAARLRVKLTSLDVDGLEISDAGKKYLMGQIDNIRNTLRKFAYFLSWSIAYSPVSLEEFVFIDHGGGVGVMSLLAKELGLGTVIYSDIWEPYCRDALTIARAANCKPADYYVKGDIDDILAFIEEKGITCNGLGSYDVIEHIYDIDAFIQKLPKLSKGPMNIAMGSVANPHNIMTKRYFREIHQKAEWGGRKKEWGCREDYCISPYVKERGKIIKEYSPDLSDHDVEKLSVATRGLIVKDIHDVVDEFLQNGVILYEPAHPTNTVNPYTGNWCERLHNLDHLQTALSREGFNVSILPGYHMISQQKNIFKRTVAGIMNYVIRLLGRKGLYISPFYSVHARKAGT